MAAELFNPSPRLFPPSFEPWQGNGSRATVAVLMSGGVDSSVAALLLQQAGWRVLGITMKIPAAEACSHPSPCCGAEAAIVCHQLRVPHYFLDVEEAFNALIIEPFRRSYREGHTPNPCVDCNTFLKFRLVWDLVEATFGIRHLATGHYARVRAIEGVFQLARATDRGRDQSYFLYGVPAGRLRHLILPLGDLTKRAARDLAREAGLPVAERPDSMELCFAGEGDYRRALAPEATASKGTILDTAGNAVGEHDGIAGFTLGQRRGLRVAVGKPLYVIRILPDDNAVVVGTQEEASRREVRAEGVNVLAPERLRAGQRLFGKIRSYGEPDPCTVAEIQGDTVAVEFDVPQFAPTPGQHLVLYDGEGRVIGGGTIGAGAPVPSPSREETLVRRPRPDTGGQRHRCGNPPIDVPNGYQA